MIETKQNIDRKTIEDSYRRAKEAQERNSYGARRYAQKSLCHAKNRDPKILHVLEKASNILNQLWEDQYGEYCRSNNIEYSHTKKPVEVQLWQEAYRTADEGHALGNFQWIYYAAYEIAYGRIER